RMKKEYSGAPFFLRRLLLRPRQPPCRVDPTAFFRHGVVAEFAERVAAQDPPQRQQPAFEGPMGGERLGGILAAGGDKPAVVPQMRADPPLVRADQRNQQPGHPSRARSGRPARCNSAASVRLTWVLLRWGVRARATKIISYPPQFGERCSAKAARITRRARLRRSEARRVGQEYQWRRIACHER